MKSFQLWILERIPIPKFDEVRKEIRPRRLDRQVVNFLSIKPIEGLSGNTIFHPTLERICVWLVENKVTWMEWRWSVGNDYLGWICNCFQKPCIFRGGQKLLYNKNLFKRPKQEGAILRELKIPCYHHYWTTKGGMLEPAKYDYRV